MDNGKTQRLWRTLYERFVGKFFCRRSPQSDVQEENSAPLDYVGESRESTVFSQNKHLEREFPNYGLRGVRSVKDIAEDGTVGHEVFMPDKRTAVQRQDGGQETSVNWEDAPVALQLLKEDNSFQGGIVRFQTSDAVRLVQQKSYIKLERDPLEEHTNKTGVVIKANPYHGNIVYSKDLSNAQKRGTAEVLAMYSEKV